MKGVDAEETVGAERNGCAEKRVEAGVRLEAEETGDAGECMVEEIMNESIQAEESMDPEENADSPSQASTSR